MDVRELVAQIHQRGFGTTETLVMHEDAGMSWEPDPSQCKAASHFATRFIFFCLNLAPAMPSGYIRRGRCRRAEGMIGNAGEATEL